MYVDPIPKQTFKYATPIYCDKKPQNVLLLHLDNNKRYVLTSKPVLRATPTLFEPKQVQSAVNTNTFTAKDSRTQSNAELTNFRNRVLFTKHSDTTLKLLGKVISYDFLATSEKHPTYTCSAPNRNRFNPDNILSVGLHDHLLNIAPLFARGSFAHAFIALFAFPCSIFIQSGKYFSIICFCNKF